jgi:hypothetical protein
MNLEQFKQLLALNPSAELQFRFSNGEMLAPHFHITEIGKVTKDFVDCGGTRRTSETCMLQTLVADDVDHRINSGKLAEILDKTDVLDLEGWFDVEAEVQTDTIGIYSVASGSVENGKLTFDFEPKNTACLAPDKCGLDVVSINAPTSTAESESGCCGGGGGGG